MQENYFKQNPMNLIEKESIEDIFQLMEGLSEMYLFRGVSDFSYQLKSSLERSVRHYQTENWLIDEFQRSIHEYLPVESHPNNKFELLSLMQHHGVPTRLLDITKSPYVALYFAASQYFHGENNVKDGAIYAFMRHNLQSASIRNILGRSKFDFDINWLNRYVKRDSKVFDEVFYNHRDDVTLIIEPFKVNKRLYAQQGLFLISNFSNTTTEHLIEKLLPKDLPEGSNDPTLIKIKIKGELKMEILKRLDRMNINSSTLFPGIDGFSRYLSEKNIYTDMYTKNDMHGY
jgi:hypothetical protein